MEQLQARVRPHCYPPQPLVEDMDNNLFTAQDIDPVSPPEHHPRVTLGITSLATADDSLLPVLQRASPSTQSNPLPPSTPPSACATEAEKDNETRPMAGGGSRGPRATQFLASRRLVRMVVPAIDDHSTKLAAQGLLVSLCTMVIVASAVLILTHLVSLQILAGLQEMSAVLRYTFMRVSVWMAFVSPTDCAIHRKGARVVVEQTSPGLWESRPWLYRTVLGLTTVPADVVLDPGPPHWSFLGQTGHITLKLHRNSTVTSIIIESDFPDSIPHNIRIWTFGPNPGQGPCRSWSLDGPSLPYQSKEQDLFPLFLGNATFQVGSTPGEHRYHISHGRRASMPTGMIMLEFLSNGGHRITRIRAIRVLGIPS